MEKIRFGLDMGNCSTKVSIVIFGETDNYEAKPLKIGKNRTGIPTVAYYDELSNKWFYGDEAGSHADRTKKPIINVRDILMSSDNEKKYLGHEFENDSCGYRFSVNDYCGRDIVDGFIGYVLQKIEDTLHNLGYDTEYEIEKVFSVTYPAYAPDEYKVYLKSMITKRGYLVNNMLSEPVSASITQYDGCKRRNISQALVIDVGGDTTDIAIVDTSRTILNVLHVESFDVAGNDFDQALYNHVVNLVKDETKGEELTHFQRFCFRNLCEESKIYLSTLNRAFIQYEGHVRITKTINRQRFEAVIAPEVEKIVSFVNEQLSTNSSIGSVILVGGGASIPFLQKSIKDEIRKHSCIEFLVDPSPIDCVPNGAAIQSLNILNVFNVTMKYYATDVWSPVFRKTIAVPIVSINEKIPCTATTKFSTSSPGQESVNIMVFETTKKPHANGSKIYWELYECKKILGTERVLEIKNPKRYGLLDIEVTVSIDKDGIANIQAVSANGDILERKFSLA